MGEFSMNKLKIEWMLERSHDLNNCKDLLNILDNNFSSILIRTGSIFWDPWSIAHKYAETTKNINFMIAVNPAMVHPVYCAIQISTFQRIYGDRVSINIVSGASKTEQHIFNDLLDIESRYKRSGEFAQIIKQLVITGRIDSFNGQFYSLSDVDINKGSNFEIVFAGSSDNTIELANNFGSAHYYAMETLQQYKENRHKINVESAIKATIFCEKESSLAWDTANNIIKNIDNAYIENLKKDLSSHESANQKHQQSLHNFSKTNLVIENNIWSGLGLVRGGGITSIVGGYEEVADIITKFYQNGLNRILIANTPELKYANNFVNGVMPILKDRGII